MMVLTAKLLTIFHLKYKKRLYLNFIYKNEILLLAGFFGLKRIVFQLKLLTLRPRQLQLKLRCKK